MAHEVESIFYYGEKPWHGLGFEVDHLLTSEEALKAAGLDWEVIQVPVYVKNGEYHQVEGAVANIRSTDNYCLGIVSEKYKVVQNKEAFSWTDALIGEGVRYETAGSLRNGKRVFLMAKLPERSLLGDAFVPYLVFTNGHDGTFGVEVVMTPVRVVCMNTLNLALRDAPRAWSTRHKGDMESKLEEARDTLTKANIYMNNLERECERLAKKSFNPAEVREILDLLFPVPNEEASKRKVDNLVYLRKSFENCLNRDDIKKFTNTAYQMVNAASDFVTHTKPLRNTKTARERVFNSFIDGNDFVDNVYKLVA